MEKIYRFRFTTNSNTAQNVTWSFLSESVVYVKGKCQV